MTVPHWISQIKEQKTGKIALSLGAVGFGFLSLYAVADAVLRKENHLPTELAKTEAVPFVKQETVDQDEGRKIPEIPPLAQVPGPVERVPLPSPALLRASVTPSVKKAPQPVYNVQRFDRCVPACDTRDPQITGAVASAQPPLPPAEAEVPLPPEPEASGNNFSLLESGGQLLGKVAEAPGMTLDKGRQVIRFAADAFR
ncbi:hypothetical protein [Agrobacterium sp. NPDC089420]|uniref:hypothetical protein n=1 Tax=Agrobacterium sp. NPDC089420 TaxID=3363918 RepID=UPI00384F19F3